MTPTPSDDIRQAMIATTGTLNKEGRTVKYTISYILLNYEINCTPVDIYNMRREVRRREKRIIEKAGEVQQNKGGRPPKVLPTTNKITTLGNVTVHKCL